MLMINLVNTSLYSFNKTYDYQSVCDPEKDSKAAAGPRSVFVVRYLLIRAGSHRFLSENYLFMHMQLLYLFHTPIGMGQKHFNKSLYCDCNSHLFLIIKIHNSNLIFSIPTCFILGFMFLSFSSLPLQTCSV